MASFLSKLEVELVNQESHSGRGDWKLLSPLEYQSDLFYKPKITVPTGFITDFASVPRVPVVFLLVGNTASEAAVLHDYIYKTLPHPFTREEADDILYEASLATGVPKWRAWIIWAGVRMFGCKFWK